MGRKVAIKQVIQGTMPGKDLESLLGAGELKYKWRFFCAFVAVAKYSLRIVCLDLGFFAFMTEKNTGKGHSLKRVILINAQYNFTIEAKGVVVN